MIKYSVITVVFNNRDGLLLTVDSVLSQNYDNWELIIKDGGSIDGTLELAQKYCFRNNKIKLFHGKDKGIYDAMNTGLKRAESDYVFFLNGGDSFVNNNVLAKISNFIEGKREYDIIYGHTLLKFKNKAISRKNKKPNYIFYGQPAIHQSTVYKTEFHKLYPYLLEYKISSDYATTLWMVQKGAKCINFDGYISNFEVSTESKSYKNQRTSRIEMELAQKEILKMSIFKRKFFRFNRWFKQSIVKFLNEYI